MDGFRFGGAKGPLIVFSTLNNQMDKVQKVDVEGEECSLVRIGGGDGAENCVEHQHRGHETFEHVHKCGCLRKISYD